MSGTGVFVKFHGESLEEAISNHFNRTGYDTVPGAVEITNNSEKPGIPYDVVTSLGTVLYSGITEKESK